MSLNNQGRVHLERSGPWIGVAGLFVLLWIAVASSQFAPWWGVVMFVLLLIPGAVLVARLSGSHPKWAAWVPLGNLAVWMIITAVGLNFWGWKAEADTSTSATRVLAAQCATKFETVRRTMDKTGNPGQPGSRLTADWDAVNARVTELSRRAVVADCPAVLDNLTNRVGGIETLVAGASGFDMVQALSTAEHDLVRAALDPMPDKLRRAFDDLRLHAPKSNAQLAAQLNAVDAADPLDETAAETALANLKAAADSNSEYRLCRQSLKVIGSYELAKE